MANSHSAILSFRGRHPPRAMIFTARILGAFLKVCILLSERCKLLKRTTPASCQSVTACVVTPILRDYLGTSLPRSRISLVPRSDAAVFQLKPNPQQELPRVVCQTITGRRVENNNAERAKPVKRLHGQSHFLRRNQYARRDAS